MGRLNDEINFMDKEYQIIVDKEFETMTEINERSIIVSDAFGLGLDNKHIFKLYDNFKFGFNKGDIIYVTGDSGSGKTVLINEIKNKLSPDEYVDYDDLIIDNDECLITGVGKDTNDAIRILSLVGLNDAFLFLRKYKELSDGQKRRYKIAKLIDLDKNIWFFDEFMATLDRETAKIISYNLQKNVRKLNKTLIVATTHIDLKDDLQPTVYIYKKFNDDIVTEYKEFVDKKKCSIINDDYSNLIVDVGKRHQYEKFHKFHYKNGALGPIKKYYTMRLNNEIIGVLAIGFCGAQCKGRNLIFDDFKKSTTDSMNKLNAEFENIDRIIIHPKYRSIGLAYHFLKEYIKLSNIKYIETIAVMAHYNPFFEKAGFIKVETSLENDTEYFNIVKILKELDIDLKLISSLHYVSEKYAKLSDLQKDQFYLMTKKLTTLYNGIRGFKIDFQKIDFTDEYFCSLFKKIFKKNVLYLYKKNEHYKEKIKSKSLMDW